MLDEMEEVGFLVLMLAVMITEVGSTCTVSSPQCYKSSTRTDADFECEWSDQDTSPGPTYILIMKSSDINESSFTKQFTTGNKLKQYILLENLLTSSWLDIWVVKQVHNKNCTSTKTTVILNNSVKYPAPSIKKKIRRGGILTLKWPRVDAYNDAAYEIRWRKFNGVWENKTFESETEDSIDNEARWESYTLQLQDHIAYEVQIRCKAIQSHLWSEWSEVVVVPLEIQLPVVSWTEKLQKEQRTVTLKWNAPPPEASLGGVTYNLTVKLPCKPYNKTTKKNHVTISVTLSGVNISIIAINNVGSSLPQEIFIPAVKHLNYCNPDSRPSKPRKKHCLEWYKLADGETRPPFVNLLHFATVENVTNDMDKNVRYYYFLHTQCKTNNKKWCTISMCPVYSKEGKPDKSPENLSVNVEHDLAMMRWSSIPVQHQRGFLEHYVIWISWENHTTVHRVFSNQTNFLTGKLEAGTSYTVHIAGETKEGAGPNSTVNFVTSPKMISTGHNGLSENDKIILGVCGLVLLLSLVCSVAMRRLRGKILPVIPSPVIPPTASSNLDHQDMKAVTEEVHEVVLLHINNLDKHNHHPDPNQGTLLQDLEFSDSENEEEEGEEAHLTDISSTGKPSFFQLKGEVLMLPEATEVADEIGREANCDLNTPLYKNSLFFENRGLESEGTPL